MSETITSPAATTTGVPRACTPEIRLTRSLLGYGVLAGPFYIVVSLAQALTRDGFDLTRHEWSLLANGPGGWIQVVNLILTGLMVIAAAVGFRRALEGGTGARWAPRLLGVYGAGLVAAGAFRADPMLGFPVGTPDGPPVHPTLHSYLHIAAAGVGFLALVAATFVMGARFRRESDSRRAWFARTTGVTFLVAFAGVASGGGSPALNLAFTAAVVLAWAWLSLTSLGLSRTLA
jgi:hypothetical membrane protein